MPMDRAKYPRNWDLIAQGVKERAGWRCEWCDKPCRMPEEQWSETVSRILANGELEWYWQTADEVFSEADGITATVERPQRFTLTTAHYPDHNPANCDRSNLVALCSTCHTQLDIHTSSMEAKRQRSLEERGQLSLLNCLGWKAPAQTKAIGPPPWHPARAAWEAANLSSMQTSDAHRQDPPEVPKAFHCQGSNAGDIPTMGDVCPDDLRLNPFIQGASGAT